MGRREYCPAPGRNLRHCMTTLGDFVSASIYHRTPAHASSSRALPEPLARYEGTVNLDAIRDPEMVSQEHRTVTVPMQAADTCILVPSCPKLAGCGYCNTACNEIAAGGLQWPCCPTLYCLQRFAVEEQIRHFGQTPMQLFRCGYRWAGRLRFLGGGTSLRVQRVTARLDKLAMHRLITCTQAACQHPRVAVWPQSLVFVHSQPRRRRHPPRGPPPPPSQLPLLNGPDAMRRSALTLPPPQRSGIAVSQLWVADGRVLQLHADRTGGGNGWGRHAYVAALCW